MMAPISSKRPTKLATVFCLFLEDDGFVADCPNGDVVDHQDDAESEAFIDML